MDKRGVTRPMARMSSEGGMDHGPPYSDSRREMLRHHHGSTLWIYWTLVMLGVWTLISPFQFGYLNEDLWVDPSGGRGVWFSDSPHTALRAILMTVSDVVSGILLIFFGWRALTPNRPVSMWLACGVGAWMSAAPVLFWAPTASAYLNGTLVGMLVITLTILIPGMPNMILYMKMGPAQPAGWSYNPSSWPQRWIMIVLGFIGLLASRYLAMFQLGYIDTIWEPFFGSGTLDALNSEMSHSLPVSDAALGAFAYTLEFLMGFMGAPSRWRTMPWMVTFFGILVIPLGLVHIVLVISQPVVVGSWCTFCLLAAAIMLPMIPLETDEVIAMIQHVRQSLRRGENFWKVFWKGGDPGDSQEDARSPALMKFADEPGMVFRSSLWGMSMPWTLTLSALLGIVLMATPALFGVEKPASIVYHLGGSLVVVIAVIAMGEVIRASRYLNILLGLGIAVLPWLLPGAGASSRVLGLILGLGISLLALPKGPVRENYGSWDRFVV